MDIGDSCFMDGTQHVSNIAILREEDLIEKPIMTFEDFGNVTSSSARLNKIDDCDDLCIDESSQNSTHHSYSDQPNLFSKQEMNVQVIPVNRYNSDSLENWTKNSTMLLTDVPDSVCGDVSNQDGGLDSQTTAICKNNCVVLQQNTTSPDRYSELRSYDQDGKILLVSKKAKPDIAEVVLGNNEIVVGDSLNIDFSHFLVDNNNTKSSPQFYDGIDYAVGKLQSNLDNFVDSDKYYDCPSCFYSTQKRDKLDRHIQRHVLLEGYHPCGKKRHTTNTPALRYRHNAEEYRCRFCHYTCTVYKAYKKHKRIHLSGDVECSVKLSCKICGKDRSSDADMQKHMKKHRDGKLFLCDVCKFGSAQMKKIIQHRRMHTGEKPHLCPHCNYRSSRRDNLRSHVRRMHKKENMYIDTFNPTELNSSEVSD